MTIAVFISLIQTCDMYFFYASHLHLVGTLI